MKEILRVPIATYRLQFDKTFTFKKAIELVDYLSSLGISHCYASPILKAKAGSTHGYDIIDHSEINSEIGTSEDFEKLARAFSKKNMGIICDIVPNHMYILDRGNKWWNDVLENGLASKHAGYFDIDWQPPRLELHNKVLLPLLDQQYGDALENQSLKVVYNAGIFALELPNVVLPTDPKSWSLILEGIVQSKDISADEKPHILELKSIITALSHLPSTTETDGEKVDERMREKEIIKRRLEKLARENEEIANLIAVRLAVVNGKKGEPATFDALEAFLNVQPYRLCYWRVASDEINYRRFFDVSEYAGIRTEKPEVFAESHALLFEFIHKQLIEGIRIDHIDGLWDPEQYLMDLREHARQAYKLSGGALSDNFDAFYTVAEKILIGNEKIPSEWPLQGTVGYDFLNQLNGIFVVQGNKKAIQEIYRNFTDVTTRPIELTYHCKKLILIVSMSSELFVLARHLDRIAEQHRSSRDFTAEGLRAALRDVIACFPVYRSYIRAGLANIREEDERSISSAISLAKRLNPAISASIFDFIQNVLLLVFPAGLNEEQIKERQDFVMRFQQLTGPVMAKGIEDTAFYRFYPISSFNEVGSNPYSFGISVDAFHKKNQERQEFRPHTMLTTSTHDTKRSEDVRARINVLSEIPDEWSKVLERWSQLNLPHKIHDGSDEVCPDANEEYLLYQTLIGTWPLYPMDSASHLQYMKRIQNYMEKAIKEAKVHTSWVNPNTKYDQGMQQFVQKALSFDAGDNPFLADFKSFVPKIMAAGMLNSLSQLLIKLTSPGVPDIYQGNEIWDFSLVDPDNRRPIDFENRKFLLTGMFDNEDGISEKLQKYMANPEDGRIKLFLTGLILRERKKLSSLFVEGKYIPLAVEGPKQEHVCAFARVLEGKVLIVVATRFFMPLLDGARPYVDPKVWRDTQVVLPVECQQNKYKNLLVGKEVEPKNNGGKTVLNLESLLTSLPFAVIL